MVDAQTQLKQRLATVLADLQAAGLEDGRAMFLLGASAANLCDKTRQPGWTQLKQALSSAEHARLLEQCRIEGNALAAAGKDQAAYAIQALALSLVAQSQSDPTLRQGEQLLDAVIERTLRTYRQHATTPH